jgi:hypothetical protein
MQRYVPACGAVLAVIAACAAFAAQPTTQSIPTAVLTSPAQLMTVPGTSFQIVMGTSSLDPGTGLPQPELIAAIGSWLASQFDLPLVGQQPRFAFVPSSRMVALRRETGALDEATRNSLVFHAPAPLPSIVAMYDNRSGIIYLPEGWSGETPAELSMLVHEIVHHMQNHSAQKYACPEEREKAAFAAQELWLALFGTHLMAEFELDALTLLVRTSCFY